MLQNSATRNQAWEYRTWRKCRPNSSSRCASSRSSTGAAAAAGPCSSSPTSTSRRSPAHSLTRPCPSSPWAARPRTHTRTHIAPPGPVALTLSKWHLSFLSLSLFLPKALAFFLRAYMYIQAIALCVDAFALSRKGNVFRAARQLRNGVESLRVGWMDWTEYRADGDWVMEYALFCFFFFDRVRDEFLQFDFLEMKNYIIEKKTAGTSI